MVDEALSYGGAADIGHLYIVVRYLKQAEDEDFYGQETDFNPFVLR